MAMTSLVRWATDATASLPSMVTRRLVIMSSLVHPVRGVPG